MTKIYFANYLIECQLCVDFQVLAWILQSGPLLRKSSSTYWELACEAVNFSNVDQTAGYLQFHAGCRNKLVPFRTERWTLITLKGLFSVNSKYYNLWKCTEFRVPKHLKMVVVLNLWGVVTDWIQNFIRHISRCTLYRLDIGLVKETGLGKCVWETTGSAVTGSSTQVPIVSVKGRWQSFWINCMKHDIWKSHLFCIFSSKLVPI